jgi:methyl-accepting chemotaxis protein
VAWLTLPPAVVTIPLAFLFISQVVRLTAADATIVLVLLMAIYAVAALVYATTLSGVTCDFEDAVAEAGDIASGMSRCLERTRAMTLVALTAGGALFAVIATLTVMRSAVGFAYFAAGALIATFPGVAWAYAAGKQQLVRTAAGISKARYVGRELSVGRKIAIVFIGSFLIALVALVELVSSKVSAKLEQLAVQSAADRFQRIYETTNLSAQIAPGVLDDLRNYIPGGYSLHLIERNGTVTNTSSPLAGEEVALIRRIGTGDSTSFSSPHVTKFARLKDGSILVLGIPWEPYRNIPLQVAWYTLVVALITTAIFVIATIVLARDVSAPIRELRTLAAAMAQGNFEAKTRIFSDDEIGQLANSFADTRQNLRRLFGRIGTSGATITHGVGIISGGTETLLRSSHEQSKLTEQANAALENVRTRIRNVLNAGDTVASLTQDASSRALELQASAEEVARSTSNLFQSVEKTSSSTTQMDRSMREMSKRTDVLAGIGDEVLSFVAEMNATADELRKAAQTTAEISRQVRVDAEAGGEAVAKTVQGITETRSLTSSTAETFDELQRSVAQISQILNVIEDVAGRTNLLALNAAIIAAQAGEQGAGFSVVADEIRELAQRTRGSTKEISAIVKAVQAGSRAAVAKVNEGVTRVEHNVRLSADASASLNKIVESATRSYDMAIKIAQALGDQALASRHLHEATSRMSDHITEINRAVREQATGTEMLASEAERVREIAGQVKRATDEQSQAGRGITAAMEKIAEDAKQMRDSLERQLRETDRIAEASRTMLDNAQQNDALARQFPGRRSRTVQRVCSTAAGTSTGMRRWSSTATASCGSTRRRSVRTSILGSAR